MSFSQVIGCAYHSQTVKHMHVGYRSHLFKYTYIQHYVHMYTCTAHIVSIRTCSNRILHICFKATSRHRHRHMLHHHCVCRVVSVCWHVLHVPCQPHSGEVPPAQLPHNDIAAVVCISDLHQVVPTCSSGAGGDMRERRGER